MGRNTSVRFSKNDDVPPVAPCVGLTRSWSRFGGNCGLFGGCPLLGKIAVCHEGHSSRQGSTRWNGAVGWEGCHTRADVLPAAGWLGRERCASGGSGHVTCW